MMIGLVLLGAFFWLYTTIFPIPDSAERVSSTIASVGVFAIGAVALFQYRGHLILEEQHQQEMERNQREMEQHQQDIEQRKREVQDAYSERLSRAIEHFGNESEAIKRGAIFEFKHLAEDSLRHRRDVRDILSQYIREEIEATARQVPDENGYARPKENVFIAAKAMSDLYEAFPEGDDCRLQLKFMNEKSGSKSKLDLEYMQLRGADLIGAGLKGAVLSSAYLNDAHLTGADLCGVHLGGSDLRGALFASAAIDDETILPKTIWDKYKKDVFGSRISLLLK
jgi:hypothetical protein